MSDFKDHFGTATGYDGFRPRYPAPLFESLAELAPGHDAAWDCATGTGQAALSLAAHFQEVIATDRSEGQLERARAHPRVRYHVADERQSGLADASVDLVTVAQALHWLDREALFAEARRVLRPRGGLGDLDLRPRRGAVIPRTG